jgi:hypothetical protein
MFLLGTCGTFVVVTMAGVSIRITKAAAEGSTELPRLIDALSVLQLTELVRVSTNKSVIIHFLSSIADGNIQCSNGLALCNFLHL